MSEVDEQMIFEMGYKAGFKNGIKGSIPREQIDEMIKEIDTYSYIPKSHLMRIIHKYTDKEQT